MANVRTIPEQLLAKNESRFRAALDAVHYALPDQDEAVELIRSTPVLRLIAIATATAEAQASSVDLSPGGDSAAVEGILSRLADEHGFTKEDVDAGARLIREGVLVDDLVGVTGATQVALGRAPESVLQYLDRPADAGQTLLDVLRGLPDLLGGLVGRLADMLGGGRSQEPIGNEVLKALYSIQAVDLVRDWVVDVSGYESVQLAIIAYAMTQGWRVDREHINGVRQSLTDDDLTPALIEALRFFESTEQGRFLKVLRKASAQ